MSPRKSPSTDPVHEEALLQVMRAIEANPQTSQRELADSMGVSLGKANYCIRALLDKGLVKAQNFRNNRNKLAYAYLLTPAGVTAKASLTAGFLKRKVAEYEALRREIDELTKEAGETRVVVQEEQSDECK